MAVVLTRTVDTRKWLLSQFAVPHGRSGRLAAKMMPMAHKVFYGPAAKRLDLGTDDVLLDVACGSGVLLDEYAGHVRHVAGIDLSDIQVEMARQRLGDRIADGSAEIVLGDAATLPWDDDTFTAAACVGSMEYFADPEQPLAEIYRVLKPGGRVVLTYGIDDSDAEAVEELEKWGLPHPTEAEVRELIEEAGFSLVSISYLEGDFRARFVRAIKPA